MNISIFSSSNEYLSMKGISAKKASNAARAIRRKRRFAGWAEITTAKAMSTTIIGRQTGDPQPLLNVVPALMGVVIPGTD